MVAEGPNTQPQPHLVHDLPFLHILVAEDNRADAELCIIELQRAGIQHSADIASSAAAFTERLRSSPYDVILSDYAMISWTGLDALEIVRGLGLDTPLILVTGMVGEERVVECFNRGISGFVYKDRLASLPAAVAGAVRAVSTRRERDRAQAALLQHRQELQDLTERLISVQERENRRVALDLHDDMAQQLAGLAFETEALARRPPQALDELRSRLRALGVKIQELAKTVNDVSHALHPAILHDLGLEAAIRNECLLLSETCRIPVSFLPEGVLSELPPEISLCLFRIAQEALRNVGQHAGAGQVQVTLTRHDHEVELVVEDTGRGFEVEQSGGKARLGLVGMKERARHVNGDLSIHSRPGLGTRVGVRVPLDSQVTSAVS